MVEEPSKLPSSLNKGTTMEALGRILKSLSQGAAHLAEGPCSRKLSAVLGFSKTPAAPTQRAQYPLIKEYSLNQSMNPYII